MLTIEHYAVVKASIKERHLAFREFLWQSNTEESFS